MPLRNFSADYNSSEGAEYGENEGRSMIFTDAVARYLLLVFSGLVERRSPRGSTFRVGDRDVPAAAAIDKACGL